MEINKEKKFQMYNKQVMKSVNGEEVEVAVPLGEYSIGDLEQQQNIYRNEKVRCEEQIVFIQKQIDMLVVEQENNPKEEIKEAKFNKKIVIKE
jgi:hypothetical protein